MEAKCINNYGVEGFFTVGRTYPLLDFDGDYIKIKNDKRYVGWEPRSRFILVDE